MDKGVLQKLNSNRFGDQTKPKTIRGKRLPPGKSYTSQGDSSTTESSSGDSETSDESGLIEETELDEDTHVMDDGDDDLPDPHQDGQAAGDARKKKRHEVWSLAEDGPSKSNCEKKRRQKGSFVVANYEGEWFPAQVSFDQKDVEEGATRLKYMAIRGQNMFQWPEKEDIFVTME